MEAHVKAAHTATAVLDGTRKNVVGLVGDGRVLQMPAGFSKRVYKKLRNSVNLRHRAVEFVPAEMGRRRPGLSMYIHNFPLTLLISPTRCPRSDRQTMG